jgi:predicted metal-binding protein
MEKIKIGIIICDRYSNCGGGKCFRSLRNREGAFARYKNIDVEIAGYTTCGGCPGENIEHAPEEMKKNGVTHIHFATGFLVGYPPCPYMEYFEKFNNTKYGLDVVFGTHPIPEKYFLTHNTMNTWNTPFLKQAINETLVGQNTRLSYD